MLRACGTSRRHVGPQDLSERLCASLSLHEVFVIIYIAPLIEMHIDCSAASPSCVTHSCLQASAVTATRSSPGLSLLNTPSPSVE